MEMDDVQIRIDVDTERTFRRHENQSYGLSAAVQVVRERNRRSLGTSDLQIAQHERNSSSGVVVGWLDHDQDLITMGRPGRAHKEARAAVLDETRVTPRSWQVSGIGSKYAVANRLTSP